MSEEEIKRCPKGHPVGTAFRGSRCSGVSCGKERYEQAKSNPQPFVQKMPAEEVAIQKRFAVAGMPQGLQGDAATEWAQDKLVAMLPEAVAQVQWDLRFGSDKVRSEAAQKVLAANGMDKREAATSKSTPTIVVNIGTGDTKVPWLERLKPTKKGE